MSLRPAHIARLAAIVLIAGTTVIAGVASAGQSSQPKQLVWFAPLPTGPLVRPNGSEDYMALFRRRARWAKAARHVQIFKLYAGWLVWAGATPSQLKRIVSDLKRRRVGQ